ncbi:MAG: hypothetical protein M3209_18595 [Acidobacteriota bacterium]|nr:hypothetical protein [Acidobacteriota bacterium]
MDCQEFRSNLSLYVDDVFETSPTIRTLCDEHLRDCPLCRTDVADLRELKSSLSAIRRPAVSPDFTDSLRRAVTTELIAQKAMQRKKSDKNDWLGWLEFNLMPYAIGTVASVLLFMMMFAALHTAMNTFRNLHNQFASGGGGSVTTVFSADTHKVYDTSLPYSPADYAALRSPYALESPSINPKGTFVSFTSSLMRGEVDQSAVVVVADVFGNGLARVADVLEPPQDPNKLEELEKILNSEPVFVPASYDKRPENLRVVLLIQKVNISGETDRKENLKSKKF